jgi:type II secretory pathway component GspD/PulD (secretin)
MNVIPQVCDDGYINMIVHPVVSSLNGFVKGAEGAATEYPRLKVREAQTQILLKSSDTVAIGGLQNEVEKESLHGVPFLMDIPFLGRLFRRETTTSSKIDLLILIKATVVDNDSYGSNSQQLQQTKLETMGMEIEQDSLEAVAVELVEPVIVPAMENIDDVDSVVVEETGDASVENEEILALLKSMDEPTTNATENADM